MFSKFVGCSVFASLLISESAASWAYAPFSGDNGIIGAVLAGSGIVWVQLNISELAADNYSAIGGPSCFSGGMSYHIHEKWDYNNDTDKVGSSACDSTYTGGHWDPWLACGGATGNDLCEDEGGCVNGSSVLGFQGYSCSTSNFYSNPYSCEVGDWSGKYGKIYVENDTLYALSGSAYEVEGNDLSVGEFSVVFHCNDGTRAFCAPFVNTSFFNVDRVEQGSGNGTSGMVAYLDDYSLFGMLDNGTNIGYFYPIFFDIPDNCSMLYYRVYEEWNSNSYYLSGNDNCSAAVGSFYDPTVSCAPGSGNIYCGDNGNTCNETSSYDCDYDEAADRFLCAPGDLSGKFGSINASETFSMVREDDELMIDLSLLAGRSLVLQCANYPWEMIACGVFMNINESVYTTTMMATTNDNNTMMTTDTGIETSVQFGAVLAVLITMMATQ